MGRGPATMSPGLNVNPSDLVDEIRRHVRTVSQIKAINQTAAGAQGPAGKAAQLDVKELQTVLAEAMTELKALSDDLAKTSS